MKATGIIRRIDELGRVVLPKELRMTRGITEGAPMEIFVEGDDIVIRKYQPGCRNCGSLEALTTVGDTTLCRTCLNKFAAAARKTSA